MGTKRVMSLILSAVMFLTACMPFGFAELLPEETDLAAVSEIVEEAVEEVAEEAAAEEEVVLELSEEELVLDLIEEEIVEEEVIEEVVEETVEEAAEEFDAGFAWYEEGTAIYADAAMEGECNVLLNMDVLYIYDKVDEAVFAVYYAVNGEIVEGYVDVEGVRLFDDELLAYFESAGDAGVAVPGADGYVLAPAAVDANMYAEATATFAIATQPVNASGAVGDTVTFNIVADGAVSYQWQYGSNGTKFYNLTWASATTAALEVPVTTSSLNWYFRCIVTDAEGATLTSDVVQIEEATAFEIGTQPVNAQASIGETATFNIVADGAVSYQWQYGSNGTKFYNLTWASATTATLEAPVTTSSLKWYFRCIVTDAEGATLTSDVVQIEEVVAFEITSQPVNAQAAIGSTATFKVAAEGATAYRWQYGSDGTKFYNLSWESATTDTLEVPVTTSSLKWYFRCIVTNANGATVTSDVVRIEEVSAFEITSQPVNAQAAIGSTATFKVAAEGATAYQWQYGSNGTKFYNLAWASATTDTLEVPVSSSSLNWYFRCIVSDASGATVTSDVVQIEEVSTFEITTQPVNAQAAIGSVATFKVAAEGAAAYQWQYGSNGTKFYNLAWESATTDTLEVDVTTSSLKWYFRCIVSDASGATVTSDVVQIEEVSVFEITSQPVNAQAAIGSVATFNIVAEGAASYQWQYGSNGTKFYNLAWESATTDTLEVDVTSSSLNWYFRCIVSDASGATVTSDVVQIEEVAVFEITTQPVNAEAAIGSVATFNIVAEGATSYQWQYGSNGTKFYNLAWASATTDTLEVDVTSSSLNWYFRCIVTNAAGDTLTSDVVVITEPAVVFEITSQPVNAEAAIDTVATFNIVATGAASYQWQYGSNGTKFYNLSWESATTDTLEVDVTSSSLKWFFRCVVTDATGATLTSDVVTITDITWKTAPAWVSFEQTAADAATLTWNAVTGANGYYIYSAAAADGEYTKIAEVAGATQYVVSGLELGTYWFKVCTYKDGETVEVSDMMSEAASVVIETLILQEGDFIYEIADGGIVIASYVGSDASVVVPATIAELPVTQIGESAFEGNTTLTSIDLPDTVEIIGRRAFADCINLSTMN